jgi:hypothetical protein
MTVAGEDFRAVEDLAVAEVVVASEALAVEVSGEEVLAGAGKRGMNKILLLHRVPQWIHRVSQSLFSVDLCDFSVLSVQQENV